jgi:hypothetical protein
VRAVVERVGRGGEGVVSVQTLEQRLVALRDLRRRVDAEVRQVKAAIADQKPPTKPRRSRNVIPDCGTESAYQRHHHRGEIADRACLDAHAAYERLRGEQRRAS